MDIYLEQPNSDNTIYPGDLITLSRFDMTSWEVHYGWYSYGGNRPFCGWYLTEANNPEHIELLLLSDLDDTYINDERFVPYDPNEPPEPNFPIFPSIIEITENGTYDVTSNTTAIVNVPQEIPPDYGKITWNGYVLTVS